MNLPGNPLEFLYDRHIHEEIPFFAAIGFLAAASVTAFVGVAYATDRARHRFYAFTHADEIRRTEEQAQAAFAREAITKPTLSLTEVRASRDLSVIVGIMLATEEQTPTAHDSRTCMQTDAAVSDAASEARTGHSSVEDSGREGPVTHEWLDRLDEQNPGMFGQPEEGQG